MSNVSLHGLASLPVQAGPSPLVPIAPDYGICDQRYGATLTPLICDRAADTLVPNDSVVPYTVDGGGPGPHTLPYTAVFGKSLSSNPFLSLTAIWQATARYGSK